MKESTASIAQNTKVLLISQVITWASSFALMLYLPRYLGPQDYGMLYYAISVSGLAVLLMDLGFTTMFVKEIARDRTSLNSLLTNGAILRLFTWPITLILSVVYVVIEGSSTHAVYLVLALGIANLFFGLYDLIHRAFVGIEQMHYRSIALIVEKAFLAIAGVSVLLLGYKSLAIAIVMLLSMAFNLLVSYFFLRRAVNLEFIVEPAKWNPMVRRGLPFMFSMMISFIYFRIDVLMLKSMTNEAVVGWYGAPYRLFDTLMFFPNILNTAVLPVFSRFVQSSREQVDHTARWILNLTLIVAVAVAALLVTFAEPIISILFGLDQYGNSVILLQILSVSLLLVYTDFVLGAVLIAHDMQKSIVKVSIVATVINVGFNFYLIPYYQHHFGNGAIGAAITTAITEAGVMLMFIRLLPKGCFGSENILVLGKILACGAAMWAIMSLAQPSVGWIPAALIGVATYAGLLLILRAISKHELQFLTSLLSFRKQDPATVSN